MAWDLGTEWDLDTAWALALVWALALEKVRTPDMGPRLIMGTSALIMGTGTATEDPAE